MKVHIKFCGGCNPRYNRSKIINELKEQFHLEIDYTPPKSNDFSIVVSGCERECVRAANTENIININQNSTVKSIAKQLDEWSENMNKFKEAYKEKFVSAEDAVQHIQDGDRVAIGHACGEPQALTRAFTSRVQNLKNVETVHMIGMGDSAYCLEESKDHVRHNSIFVGNKNERQAIKEGRGDYTPRYFSKIPSLFTDGSLTPDVALVQVSSPDVHGYVSFGVSVDYSLTAARVAKLKIAQVNSHMPRCHGECFMHISEFDYLVEEDIPILELSRSELTEVEKEIGKNCASLIHDGDTLQLGIGALPDAVLLSLKDKKDLGIHSEMFSDGVVELVEAGVITNKKKTLHPGKLVATFLMGSQKLYDFIDDNPSVYMASADYTNDPYVIAKNDNLISINSCISVDFMGQVSAESIGTMQISGVGGQVDFVRGANLSKGGKSIIAMTSTAKGGTVSKIVPMLEPGAAVTTGRNDVAYIVTEYGVADLRGKSLRERARLLINIAHPKFRDELIHEWEMRFQMEF
ncbi:4-hydroxybutyrate CoA-transferase [Aequitasia blattaphilus]